MARQTKAQQVERQEAIAQLREWIKPGDTVYTILDHVSSSGMSRAIRVVIPYTRFNDSRPCTCDANVDSVLSCDRHSHPEIDHLHPNWAIGKALGLKHWRRNGREQDALVIGGCGMDMGLHLVYELSHVLYGAQLHADVYKADATHLHTDGTGPLLTREGAPDGKVWVGGYRCLGKGKCPSNYHNNHHDTIRCEGTTVWNNDGPNTGTRCRRPNDQLFGKHEDTPDNWPTRRRELEGGEYIEIPVYAIQEGAAPPVICPTCNGEGRLPNPEGPERWDLVHVDGYALKHRWL